MKTTKFPLNLTGFEYGKLKVMNLAEVRPRKRPGSRTYYWNCLCSCGKTIIVSTSRLRRGQRGCAKCSNAKLAHGQAYLNKVLSQYKRGAKKRGFIFSLSNERFLELVKENCYYCGIVPSRIHAHSKVYGKIPINGIDRLNPTEGYTNTNSVSCCFTCNRAKSNLSIDEFRAWIKQLIIYNVIDNDSVGGSQK